VLGMNMKKSAKAALLSAFVFPGAGHIYLRKYTAGILLAGVSFAAIYYLITKTVERAFEISEKIQNGDIPLDVQAITELVAQQSNGADTQVLNIALIAFFIFWLIGIFGAYRAGRNLARR
jgi:TM2 domain-containing membrane protein YozV